MCLSFWGCCRILLTKQDRNNNALFLSAIWEDMFYQQTLAPESLTLKGCEKLMQRSVGSFLWIAIPFFGRKILSAWYIMQSLCLITICQLLLAPVKSSCLMIKHLLYWGQNTIMFRLMIKSYQIHKYHKSFFLYVMNPIETSCFHKDMPSSSWTTRTDPCHPSASDISAAAAAAEIVELGGSRTSWRSS